MIVWTNGMSLKETQQQVVFAALKFYRNDKLTASNALKIPIEALENYIDEYSKERAEHEIRLSEFRKRQEEFKLRARGLPVPAPHEPDRIKETLKEPKKRKFD